jgi:hypothetical protein
MTRGSGLLAARPRRGVAFLAAVLAGGVLAVAPAGRADASLDLGLPVQGDCAVSGTVNFTPFLGKLPQPTTLSLDVDGACNGVGAGGSQVHILMGATLGTASCAAIEGSLGGNVSFTNSSITGYLGHGTLLGSLETLQLDIADSGQQFFGVLELADTTALAALACANGNLDGISVTGLFSFASV